MTVEITGVEIAADKITIEAINLESVYAENLFEDFDCTPVTFEFDAKRHSDRTYLYKVARGQRKCQNAKSMGEMLENLCGVITQLSENFKVAQATA